MILPARAARCLAVVLIATLPGVAASLPAEGAARSRPDLVVAKLTAPAAAVSGDLVTLVDTTANTGRAKAARSVTRFYLSKDTTRSRGDKVLGARAVPGIPRKGSRAAATEVRIPAATSARRYWVIACADAKKQVRERKEGNNCGISASMIRVTKPEPPPPPPAEDEGPSASGLDALTEAAGPLHVLRSPTATGRAIASAVDPSRAVTQVVGPAGGTISLTDADGNGLSLAVPGDALVAPVEITATPITSLDGAQAAGGEGIGVRLEPAGLTFLRPAVLTVVPADGDTARRAVGMVSESDGVATRPAMLLPDPDRIAMPVHHFSMVRVLVSNGDGGWVSQFFTAEEYTKTIESRIARIVEQMRDGDGDPQDLADALEKAFDDLYNGVIAPILTQSVGDCGYFRDSFSSALSYSRSRALLSLSDAGQDGAIMAALADSLRNCWAEQTTECLTMTPGRWGMILSTARTMALMSIKLDDGEDADPFALDWCGNVNGFIDLDQSSVHESIGGSLTTETMKTRMWVSADSRVWWDVENPELYVVHLHTDTGTVVDVTASFSETDTYQWGDRTCDLSRTAEGQLSQARANLLSGHIKLSRSAHEAATPEGFSVVGYGAGIPNLHVPVTHTDSCRPPEDPYDHYFNWYNTLSQGEYRMAVDPEEGRLHTSHTEIKTPCAGCLTTTYTINADLHVDGLAAFLAESD